MPSTWRAKAPAIPARTLHYGLWHGSSTPTAAVPVAPNTSSSNSVPRVNARCAYPRPPASRPPKLAARCRRLSVALASTSAQAVAWLPRHSLPGGRNRCLREGRGRSTGSHPAMPLADACRRARRDSANAKPDRARPFGASTRWRIKSTDSSPLAGAAHRLAKATMRPSASITGFARLSRHLAYR